MQSLHLLLDAEKPVPRQAELLTTPPPCKTSSCERRISSPLRSCGACAVPGDGVYGLPRGLARTIEPRAPIVKLGFTEGYPLL
jgi:hypothetical protein